MERSLQIAHSIRCLCALVRISRSLRAGGSRKRSRNRRGLRNGIADGVRGSIPSLRNRLRRLWGCCQRCTDSLHLRPSHRENAWQVSACRVVSIRSTFKCIGRLSDHIQAPEFPTPIFSCPFLCTPSSDSRLAPRRSCLHRLHGGYSDRSRSHCACMP